MVAVSQEVDITVVSCQLWQSTYGGLKGEEAKNLTQVKKQSPQSKKSLAEVGS